MSESQIRILVLDRGFVLVGRCPDPEGYALWLPVEDARIVRRWGTSRGLAELVAGPLPDTVLDAPASERVPLRAVLRVIEVDQDRWAAHLSQPAAGRTGGRRAART